MSDENTFRAIVADIADDQRAMFIAAPEVMSLRWALREIDRLRGLDRLREKLAAHPCHAQGCLAAEDCPACLARGTQPPGKGSPPE